MTFWYFYGRLADSLAIWYILWSFGIFGREIWQLWLKINPSG
jgi:hypothetical protein